MIIFKFAIDSGTHSVCTSSTSSLSDMAAACGVRWVVVVGKVQDDECPARAINEQDRGRYGEP